jgi:hypothetical protein
MLQVSTSPAFKTTTSMLLLLFMTPEGFFKAEVTAAMA